MAALTDLADEVIERICREVLQTVPSGDRWRFEDGLAIVALGGYGRGELSPRSDIDIMFLHRPSIRQDIVKIPGRILQALWDLGFQIGHSSRTIRDCVEIGHRDLTVRTALMEARFLSGSRELFDKFRSRYQRKVISSRADRYIAARIRNRGVEYEQYGTTIHLLEPHIKKSRGGLRDLHLLQWLARTRYQTISLDHLKQHGIVSKNDHKILIEAREFLWRIRNELHFHAGRCQDSLTFEEQMRIAAERGFKDKKNILGVEQFMQRYYDHTTAIAEITGLCIEGMARPTLWNEFRNRVFRKKIGGYFLLSGDELSILPECRSEVFSRGEWVLDLFWTMANSRARLSIETQGQLTAMRNQWPPEAFTNTESRTAFLRLLSMKNGVSESLRYLHRFRVLEQILPAFRRVRGLMQFNVYHKYTVDEHCLLAVEEAERMSHQEGTAGRAFHEVRHREILYLALLLHDLGKGLRGDHSKEGAVMASEVARQLGLTANHCEQLIFLVNQHLLMTHLAFRRDLSDNRVLAQFAKTVGTPETLKILYLMTMADVAAVGPGTLTAWKGNLLTELYTKTLDILTGGMVVEAGEEKFKRVRERIVQRLQGIVDTAWLASQLEAMSGRYLIRNTEDRIILDLKRIHRLEPKGVKVYAENDLERNLTEYSVYTFDDITSGTFYKMTTALAAQGLQILDATITTWSNNIVIDTFQVQDSDYSGPPGPTRLQEVQESITRILLGEIDLEPLSDTGARIRSDSFAFPRETPVRIELDNDTSEDYTIVEVFAHDRPGLLAVIARALFVLGLSVQSAKVATHQDQILDIFYVMDGAGQKIVDLDRIRKFKLTLKKEIEQYMEASRVQ